MRENFELVRLSTVQTKIAVYGWRDSAEYVAATKKIEFSCAAVISFATSVSWTSRQTVLVCGVRGPLVKHIR
jgi:hypothetical protein